MSWEARARTSSSSGASRLTSRAAASRAFMARLACGTRVSTARRTAGTTKAGPAASSVVVVVSVRVVSVLMAVNLRAEWIVGKVHFHG
ncbi:hypothetical protein SBRY_30041 [Actinacidiphila bryophytorum]|uniref:Uncharacterized protein n=1 Tax=Actinacidiphila bryophytorum TaxID=1436133 RepID=A0A9W4H0A8_9ACTN|nr:hypothetical protein SBRY_30041 [Actinacidiphila bryophytorum]